MEYFFLAITFFIGGLLLMIACWDIIVSEIQYRKIMFKTWRMMRMMKRKYRHDVFLHGQFRQCEKIARKALWSKRKEEKN